MEVLCKLLTCVDMNLKAENFLNSLNNKTIALCGIGRSNFPLIKLFSAYGAKIIACDRRNREQLGDMAIECEKAGATLSLGEGYLKDLNANIILRTPGMKFYMPELNEMRNEGRVVTSEMELFFQLCPCKIIAVTGSDGKTTTTTIIAEMLKSAGKRVHLGGNIGKPLLPEIKDINEDDYAVVELSSFQLISMRESCDISVITNISPNHLDIHKDMDEYVNSKKNIFIHQNAFSVTVLNAENDITSGFADEVRGDVRMFSLKKPVYNGAYMADNGDIILCNHGKESTIMNRSDIKLLGDHNLENYITAICAVRDIVSSEDMLKVAKNFAGVEHRSEFVREVNGVKYYNDSIASSPTRTIKGTLSLYDDKINLIAGGYDKHIPYDDLGVKIVEKVKYLILMGDTASRIEAAVKKAPNYSIFNPTIVKVTNMEEAVAEAYKRSVKGDIVSLSPASASFDLYKDFDARGKDFKRLVNLLEERK